MIDVQHLTIKKAHEHLLKGDFSAHELAGAYKKIIQEKNQEIHAYLEVFKDIDEQAKKADAKIKEGTGDMLTGIPLAIKDNILIKGRVASSASKILEHYTATYDATVISKLKEKMPVFLGRTNMDEFAMGASTENSAFGVTKNPHDTSRVPGGSSGGSAAAVAMNGTLAALGSDTGGSIRQPAGFCGIVGLKPSFGRVSRYGLMAMASSLDQIGPLTKTVEDAEIIFNTIAGKDRFDSTSVDGTSDVLKEKKTLGIPFSFIEKGMAEDVKKLFDDAVQKLKNLGYTIKDIKLPSIDYALAVYYIIVPAEVSSNLARFDGVKYGLHKDGKDLLEDYLLTRHEGLGDEVRRRIILGTYVLSSGYYDAYYYKANEVRQAIIKEFEAALQDVDAIVMPTSPHPAFKIGEKVSDPLAMYLEDIFTVPINIAGLPAISIPAGTVEREGKALPFGIQLVGPYKREDVLFAIGKKFEAVL
jgi:aspartyl-tRNA(Asn)/glutamyl-tRNA(Gln) amidotransferase subunit A